MIELELVKVVSVRHVRDHVLWLEFSDGLRGEVDLANQLHGEMFAPLRDPAVFARARVDCGTVAWPSGIDWAPESLHDQVRAAKGLPPRSYDDERRARLAYVLAMPEISRFFGMVIRMLPSEDAPSHFHVQYGEYEIAINIRDGFVTGRFPKRALRLVLEWQELHQDELLANWDLMRAGQEPRAIEPLS
jgi:hypothetical protein